MEWIDIEEAEPEFGQKVLILIDTGGNIEKGRYLGDGEFMGNWFNRRGKNHYYKVTHWMPKPAMPKDYFCKVSGLSE